jgi:hypothetical protein
LILTIIPIITPSIHQRDILNLYSFCLPKNKESIIEFITFQGILLIKKSKKLPLPKELT